MNKETIKAGIVVTQRAIQEGNAAELGRCIARYVVIRSEKLSADVLLSEAINSQFGGAA